MGGRAGSSWWMSSMHQTETDRCLFEHVGSIAVRVSNQVFVFTARCLGGGMLASIPLDDI